MGGRAVPLGTISGGSSAARSAPTGLERRRAPGSCEESSLPVNRRAGGGRHMGVCHRTIVLNRRRRGDLRRQRRGGLGSAGGVQCGPVWSGAVDDRETMTPAPPFSVGPTHLPRPRSRRSRAATRMSDTPVTIIGLLIFGLVYIELGEGLSGLGLSLLLAAALAETAILVGRSPRARAFCGAAYGERCRRPRRPPWPPAVSRSPLG